jgi:hypothetical protein
MSIAKDILTGYKVSPAASMRAANVTEKRRITRDTVFVFFTVRHKICP